MQKVKNNYKQDIYIDRFDNYFNNSVCDAHKSFSNLAIGYVFNAVNNSQKFLLLSQKSSVYTKNKFNWLELIIASQKHDIVYVVDKQNLEKYSNVEMLLQNSNQFEIEYILNMFLKNHKEQTVDSTFIVYNRDKNLINVANLAKLKKNLKDNTYIDCLDNDFAKNNPMSYSAFNKDCRFSPEIFDFVFKSIIKCNEFCVIETPKVYLNQFTKMQILFASYLGKQVKVIKEKDIETILNSSQTSLSSYMRNCDLKSMLKKYDINTSNIYNSSTHGME